MFPGFEKIVEERIQLAQRQGAFEDLPGAGMPLPTDDMSNIPEDLRLAYKILKNAGFTAPELELKREIRQTEDLLSDVSDVAERYRILKKINFLILKFNMMRNGCVSFEVAQHYEANLVDRMVSHKTDNAKR
jgi:hypothetical protein